MGVLYRRAKEGTEPFYPHTLARNVTTTDGRTVEDVLEEMGTGGGVVEALSNLEIEEMMQT